jgi:hypothetical protein
VIMTEHACGGCGETWSTNCAADDITCPECEAKWCPACGTWFGGDAGEPEDQGVMVSREDLRAVVKLARMSRHLAEDPATDRLAAAAGEAVSGE